MFVYYCHSVNDTDTFVFTLLRYGVSLVVKGCFESGRSSNDLPRVQACMAHVENRRG